MTGCFFIIARRQPLSVCREVSHRRVRGGGTKAERIARRHEYKKSCHSEQEKRNPMKFYAVRKLV